METKFVPTFTLHNITLEKIPQEIGRRFKLDRTQRIQNVTLELDEASLVGEKDFNQMTFLEQAREVGREAEKNGMTPDKLEDILGEEVKHIL